MPDVDGWQQNVLNRAAQLVAEAMDLLDAHQGPAEAGVHLELALQVLRRLLAQA